MTRRPPHALGPETADEAEAQFYEALRQGDLESLMALWADDDEITCLHPGGPRVIGPAAIRSSFEAVFANGGIPVRADHVHRLQRPGAALHHLVELIQVPADGGGTQTAWVLASNFYVKTPLGWRIAAHHASPGLAHELPTQGDAPSTLH
jgi:ketosteroid isomerase-like protein